VGTDAAVEAFLITPIQGVRPFPTIADYLLWLVDRPGTASFNVDAQPLGIGVWRMTIQLHSDAGSQVSAECSFNEKLGFAAGPVWYDCPQISRLWTEFVPTHFQSIQEARPFLPPIPIFSPSVLPGSFQFSRLEFPLTPDSAAMNPFLVHIIFEDKLGNNVRLSQQPSGLNGPVFGEFSQCLLGSFNAPRSCLAWSGMANYFLLSSDTVDAQVLAEFQMMVGQ
jgi:hypothetical protein